MSLLASLILNIIVWKGYFFLLFCMQYEEALDMCLDHHINISEEMGEKMSLPKDHPDSKYRLRLLEKLGECAFKQGSYHLATKKFTQAGNRVKVYKLHLQTSNVCTDIVNTLAC